MADFFSPLPAPMYTGIEPKAPAPVAPGISEADKLAADLASIRSTNDNAEAAALMEVARQRDSGLALNNNVVQEWENLPMAEFLAKHGQDTYNQMAAMDVRGSHAKDLAAADRSTGQVVQDAGVDIAEGAAQGALGVTSMMQQLNPINLVIPGAGEAMGKAFAKTSKVVSDLAEAMHSDPINKRNYVNDLRTRLDTQDNNAQFESERDEQGALLANLRALGRDTLDGTKRWVEDPAMAGQAITEGVGSLLVGAPAGKVVGGLGKAANVAITRARGVTGPAVSDVGSKAVQKALDQVSFPIGVGLMEGGSNYNQSFQEVMDTPFEQLAQQSPRFNELAQTMGPEKAREHLAHQSATVAGSLSGVVGAAAGKLVEGIEKAPFRLTGSTPLAAGKEFVEEAVQSGAGEFAGNLGQVASGANPEANLLEGVGSAAIQGGLAGAGTTVTMRAPGLALGAAAEAAGTSLNYGYEKLKGRSVRLAAEAQADSVVSEEKLGPVVAAAAAEAPVVAEGLRTVAAELGAKPEEVDAYISRVQAAVQLQNEDFPAMPAATAERVVALSEQLGGQMPDKLQTAMVVASMIEDQKLPERDRNEAVLFLLKQTSDLNKLFVEDQPEFLNKVSHDRPEIQKFQQYAAGLTSIQALPAVKKALEWAQTQMQMPAQDLTNVDLNSAEGQKIVSGVVDAATLVPMAVNPQVAEHILKQADEGTLSLTPERRRVIRGATALLNSSRLYAANMRAMEPIALEDQADELQGELDVSKDRDERMDFVTRQIETEGGAKAHQLSLVTHVQEFQDAVANGDMKLARKKAVRMSLFARSHMNKVGALNSSAETGKKVSYKALGNDMDMYDAPGIDLQIGNAGSERFARKVHAEAVSIAQLANDFATQYPEFGISQVTVPDLILDNGPAIIKDNKREGAERGSSTTPTQSKPVQATTSRPNEPVSKSELPPPPSQPARAPEVKSPAVEEVAPVATGPAENVDDIVEAVIDRISKEIPDATEAKETTPAPVVTAVEAAPEVSPEPVVSPTISDAEIVASLDAVEDEAPALTTAEVFPNLVQPKGRNWFHRAFQMPKTATARLSRLENPLADVYELLARSTRLVSFIGKDVSYDVTTEDREDFRQLMKMGNFALSHMKTRLRDVVTAKKTNKKGEAQKSILELLVEGDEAPLRFRDLRALNILDRTDTAFRYNPQLIQSAVIAGLDWVLNVQDRSVKLDADDVAGIMEVSAADAENYVDEFNRGLSTDVAVRGLAEHIQKVWGVSSNRAEREAYTKGIPEAVAKEVLYGLQAAGLLELGMLKAPDLTVKTFGRVWFDTRTDDDQSLINRLGGVSELLSDIALIDREVEGYAIGEAGENMDVDGTQLRNPTLKTTSQQKRVLENVQKTKYLPNMEVFDLVQAMGEEAFVTLMSGIPFKQGDLKKKYTETSYNRIHWESVKGQQRGYSSSLHNVAKQMAAVKKHADKAGVSASEMPTYYKHHINKLGRIQMAGLSNPQADKLAREIFMSTKAKLNLSGNRPDWDLFLLTIGQGVGDQLDGLKTEKESLSTIVARVEEGVFAEDGKLRPLVNQLKIWLENRENGQGKQLPDDALALFTEAKLSMHGMHSLVAVARYELARDRGADLSAFETSNYLEADGKTNGPINSLMLMGAGEFNSEWLRMVNKGGAFLGELNKSLDQHPDRADLYKEAADLAQLHMNTMAQELASESPEALEQLHAFKRVLNELNSDVELDSDGNLTIKRGLTKNPLTITIYGSGADGIAGKITSELVSVIYEKMSEAAAAGATEVNFTADFNRMLAFRPGTDEESGNRFLSRSRASVAAGKPQDFAFDKAQYDSLKDNVKMFLVDPIRQAIQEMVDAHVSTTTSALQESSQLQSIFEKALFVTDVTIKVAELKANAEALDYREGEFLSRNEMEDIRKKNEAFSSVIDTGTQRYSMSGGETSELFEKTRIVVADGQTIDVTMPEGLSRSLTGDLRTPAYVQAPTLAGVRAIPTMVVGSGDGQMMLNGMSNQKIASRTLPTFDGLQMPADAMVEFSRDINEAVFKTWTTDANPLRAAAESFANFVRHRPVEALFEGGVVNKIQEKALLEISQAYHGTLKVPAADILSPAEAQVYLEATLEKLEALANDIDVRRQVIAEMPFSVDQMASAKSPYVNQGTIAVPVGADALTIVAAMNARYDELRADASQKKQNQAAVEKTDQKLVDMIANLALEDDTGARVFHGKGLDSFFRSLSDILNPTQKEMARAAIKNLSGTDYRVVFGSNEQLDAWEQVYNADDFQPNTRDIYGKIDTKNKIIIISNISQETIVHELIHAATIEKLNAAYAPKSNLSKEDRDAVSRLDALMVEWLASDLHETGPYAAAKKMAVSHIRGWQKAGNKAAALNEFMAWVLSNQHLSQRAAKMKVKNSLARIVGDALAALKALIWGAPNKGPRVGDSLLSNLRFNTRILMASPSRVEGLKKDFAAVTMFQSRTFGSNNRLTELREAFNAKVIAWMNSEGGLLGQVQANNRVNDAVQAHKDATQVAAAFAWQFPDLGNMQAFSTFQAIQTALMTEASLNTTSLTRVEEIYAHVIKKLEVANFRLNGDPNDQNDITQAQNKLQVLQGVFGTKTDKYGRSSLMSSFLALAMTSDTFRKVLSKMEKPVADKVANNSVDNILDNLGNGALNRLTTLLAGERKSEQNVQAALDVLTKSMIDNVGDQRSFIEQHAEGGLSRADSWTADKIQELSHKGFVKSKDVIANSSSKVVRAGARAVLAASVLVNEQDAEAAQLGLVSSMNRRGGMESLRSFANEIVGRNKENSPVYDMISKVRALVQQTRQQFRDKLPDELLGKFTKTVTKAEKTAMFKALAKTDLASLAGAYGLDGALGLVSDQTRLTGEIQALEQSIQASDPRRFQKLQAKSRQLAHYMMTGEHGIRLLRNAEAIARLLGDAGGYKATVDPQLVSDIDKLVSLYALQQLDQDSRDSVASLIRDESEGVKFITSYLMGQRVDELAKVNRTVEARLNHYKGHVPSEVQQGGSLIIASASEHAHLLMRGYTKVADYNGSSADRILGARAYYFAPVSGTAPFSQGVLQTVHQTASGVDPETGYTVGEVMAGRIEDRQIVRLIERQLNNQRANTTEQLLPVYDDRGNIVAFERAADPSKLVNLNKSTDLPAMIGVWRGRQAEELMAQTVNEELIDKLYDRWIIDQRAGRENEYVNIAQLGANDDRILQEAARLIPKGSRDYIKNRFGRDVFMVRRDMLLDTFGSRQASVGDLFTGKTRWDPKVGKKFEEIAIGIIGKKAYPVLVSAEKNVQEFVTNAKHLIVVKSVIVPVANIVSNFFQLLNRGVPLRSIIEGAGRKTAELNFYIKSRDKELGLEAELRAAKAVTNFVSIRKLEAELQSIRDSQKRLSIWPLIEAGEFSAISNGEVTAEDLALADGKWTNFVERKISELPDGIRTVARYALVTRDTALYQGLARSVQYGDFVAKAILYDDLKGRKKMVPVEAIGTVNEAFVNYNRLAGRGRQYLESVGLLWFYSYKIRSMKEAVYMLRHNPLKSLLMTLLPGLPVLGDIGSPVTDNILAVGADGRLDYSIGPGMGLNSFSLNPWVNLAR